MTMFFSWRAANSLSRPMGLVLFIPTQPFRRFCNDDPTLLNGGLEECCTSLWPASLRYDDAPGSGLSFGSVKLPLDTGEIIVVMVNTSRGS